MSRSIAAMLPFVLLCTLPALGQSPDVSSLITAYKADRAAVEKLTTPELLASSDALIKKAEAAKSPEQAMRLIREARWRLPYRPKNLPPHISMVLGATRLRHTDRINSLVYTPNGQNIVSGSRDGSVRMWDLSAGRELWSYTELGEIKPPADAKVQDDVLKIASVAVSIDGTTIAAAGYNEIHLLNAKDGKKIKTLTGHKGQVKGVVFSNDGKQLASVGDDKVLKIWDVAKGEAVITHDLSKIAGANNPVGRFEAIAWAPKLKHVAVTNSDGKLAVFDVSGTDAKMKMAATIVNSSTSVYCCKYTPDGTGLVTGSEETTPPRITAAPAADAPPANPNPGVVPAVRNFPGAKRRTSSLDLSPDGQLLVTGGEDAVVRVWEMNSGKQLKQFSAHTTEVLAVSVRPDGKEVATADEAGIIRLWPLAANDEHTTAADGTGTVWCVASNPSGTKYAAAGADRTIRVYDSGTGDKLKELKGHTAAVGALAFLDDDTIASAGGDRAVRIWNLKEEGSPKVLTGHSSVILALAAGESGRILYSGSIDKTLKKWDVATGKLLASWDAKSAVCGIAVNGNRVIFGGADGWITVLEPKDASFVVKYQTGAHTSGVAAVALSPDGTILTSAGGDGNFRVWSVAANGQLAAKAMFEAIMNTTTNSPFPLSTVGFSADGKAVAFAGQDGLIRLYDPIGLRETRSLRGHTDWVAGVTFTEGGKSLVGCGTDGIVRRFALAQDVIAAVPGHIRAASSVAVSPDGKKAVTIGQDEWKVWDLTTGREIGMHSAPTFKTQVSIFTGPDEMIVGGDSEKISWYTVSTGQRSKGESIGGNQIYSLASNGSDVGIWQLRLDASEFVAIRGGKIGEPYKLPGEKQETKKILCATISPDATIGLAAQADQNVQVIDLVTRKMTGELWKLYDASPVDLAIVPDKSKVISIDENGGIKVATLADRKVVATAKAHEKGCNGIIIAKSGDRFATLGSDGMVIVWDIAAKELRRWAMPIEIKSAGFSGDGRKLVTANADGTAFVLDVP